MEPRGRTRTKQCFLLLSICYCNSLAKSSSLGSSLAYFVVVQLKVSEFPIEESFGGRQEEAMVVGFTREGVYERKDFLFGQL